MHHDAAYFRDLAMHCRKLAETCRDAETLRLLLAMAEDFEQEAEAMKFTPAEPPQT